MNKILHPNESKNLISALLEHFEPVDLDGLNLRAQLLDRHDKKYVLTTSELCAFLAYAQNHFDVLMMNGLRQFEYRTVYFDSVGLHCYHDHNKGRRQRVKIRYRHYVDHDLYFFEVKLKGRRNVTHKYRTPVTALLDQVETVPQTLRGFCQDSIAAHYRQGWDHQWFRGVTVNYNRITLVARAGGERITIDNGMSFHDGDQAVSLRPNKWIVEVKSHEGTSDTDRWLFRHRNRPVPRCSKYCIGVSLLKLPQQNNRFTPVILRNFNHAA